MKKISLVIVLLLVTLLLTGCVFLTENFQAYEEIEQISSIEVYYFDTWYYPETVDNSLEPIKIIEKSDYAETINDLEQLEYRWGLLLFAANDPSFELYQFIIKINYKSGVYQYVSNSGAVYTFDASSNELDHFFGGVDDEIWNGLIIKYIGEDLFNQYNQD